MPEGTNAGGNGQAPTATSGNGQAPTQGTPNAGNGQAPASNTANEPYTPPDAETWKRTQSELAEARREAINYRKRAEEADTAKLTDEQKREKRMADLEKAHSDLQRTHQDRVLQYEVRLSAAAANFRDPADALSLIDLAAVKFDEDGTPKNLSELIEAIAKSKPYLLREDGSAPSVSAGQGQGRPNASTAGGATNPSRTSTNGGAKIPLSWDYITQLQQPGNTNEYLARRPEIQAWMVANARSRPRR